MKLKIAAIKHNICTKAVPLRPNSYCALQRAIFLNSATVVKKTFSLVAAGSSYLPSVERSALPYDLPRNIVGVVFITKVHLSNNTI